MPALAFEQLSISILTRMGFTCCHTGRVNDKGIDFFANQNKQKYLGQCKSYKTKLSLHHVTPFVYVLEKHNLPGIFTTLTGYSPLCVREVMDMKVPLILLTLNQEGIKQCFVNDSAIELVKVKQISNNGSTLYEIK